MPPVNAVLAYASCSSCFSFLFSLIKRQSQSPDRSSSLFTHTRPSFIAISLFVLYFNTYSLSNIASVDLLALVLPLPFTVGLIQKTKSISTTRPTCWPRRPSVFTMHPSLIIFSFVSIFSFFTMTSAMISHTTVTTTTTITTTATTSTASATSTCSGECPPALRDASSVSVVVIATHLNYSANLVCCSSLQSSEDATIAFLLKLLGITLSSSCLIGTQCSYTSNKW